MDQRINFEAIDAFMRSGEFPVRLGLWQRSWRTFQASTRRILRLASTANLSGESSAPKSSCWAIYHSGEWDNISFILEMFHVFERLHFPN